MRSPVHRFPCATLLVLGLLAVKPASAFTVIDPTNLVQNTLTAVRTLEMANNQVRQLQNETQMLLNQAYAQVEQFTGMPAPREVMAAALAAS